MLVARPNGRHRGAMPEPFVQRDTRRPPQRTPRRLLLEPVGRRELLSEEAGHRWIVHAAEALPDTFDDRSADHLPRLTGTHLGRASTPAASAIRANSSRTVRGSPFDTTNACPASSCRAIERRDERVGGVGRRRSCRSVPCPSRRARVGRGGRGRRSGPTSWVSPGPHTRCGRTATTGMLGRRARASARRSAIALLVA